MDGTSPESNTKPERHALRQDWQAVYQSDPNAMPSQSPEWADALASAGLWRVATRMFVTQAGRKIVLPLVRIGLPGIAGEFSMARHWGYGGLLAEGGATAGDVEFVVRSLSMSGLVYFRIRPNPLQASLWREAITAMRRVERTSQVIDLRAGLDAVKAGFGSSAWTGIKRAQKASVRIEAACGGKLLAEFFKLAYKERRHWALRQNEPQWLAQIRYRMVDSESKWQRIANQLGERFRVSIAWHGETPAAAGIVILHGNAHGMRAAMDPEIRKIGASHLLNLAVIEDACAHGARWLNLGESATEGSSEFKKSFGAVSVTVPELSFERLPLSGCATFARNTVKRLVGFRPAQGGTNKL